MIIREIILALAQVVDLAFTIYIFIIIARAILSWVNPDPYNPIVRFLHSATDPVLYKIQRWIPMTFGGIDFSPLVLLVVLTFSQRVIHAVFLQLASSF
jgi:YggT family protein